MLAARCDGDDTVSRNLNAQLGAQEGEHEFGDVSGVFVKRPMAEPFKEFDPRGREGDLLPLG
jgi:hypothetical protein